MKPFNLVYAVLGGVVVTSGLLGVALAIFPVSLHQPTADTGAELAPVSQEEQGTAMASADRAAGDTARDRAGASLDGDQLARAGSQPAFAAPTPEYRALLSRPVLPAADPPPTLPETALAAAAPAAPVRTAVTPPVSAAPAAPVRTAVTPPVSAPPAASQAPRVLRVAQVTAPDVASPDAADQAPELPGADLHRATFGTPLAERKVVRITR